MLRSRFQLNINKLSFRVPTTLIRLRGQTVREIKQDKLAPTTTLNWNVFTTLALLYSQTYEKKKHALKCKLIPCLTTTETNTSNISITAHFKHFKSHISLLSWQRSRWISAPSSNIWAVAAKSIQRKRRESRKHIFKGLLFFGREWS